MSKYHIEIENDAEFNAVAHLRGYCHDSTNCKLCEIAKILHEQLQTMREARVRIDEIRAELVEARAVQADLQRFADSIISGV